MPVSRRSQVSAWLALPAICALFAASPARAADPTTATTSSGLYVNLGGGVNLESAPSATETPPIGNPGQHSWHYNAGESGIFGLGWALGNGLRLEVDTNYLNNELRSVSGYASGLRAGGLEQKVGGLASVLYDINLGLPVLIPEDYVADLPVRLGLYRRIGALPGDAESEALAAELADRFGPLPPEVENLLETVALKRACRAANVEKLDAGPKGMVIGFRKNDFANPAGLIAWISSRGGTVKLRPDQKLVVVRDMDVAARMKLAQDVLGSLVKLSRLETV